jgi:hypothetical protein
MRPGLVFVGLFAILIGLFVLLQDSLGSLSIFLLQAALVFVVLAGATWFRYAKRRRGWLFFGDEDEAIEEPVAQTDADAESAEYRKAS